MTTVNIGLSDDQAAALKAKASAPGVNVEDWFSAVNRSEDLALFADYSSDVTSEGQGY